MEKIKIEDIKDEEILEQLEKDDTSSLSESVMKVLLGEGKKKMKDEDCGPKKDEEDLEESEDEDLEEAKKPDFIKKKMKEEDEEEDEDEDEDLEEAKKPDFIKKKMKDEDELEESEDEDEAEDELEESEDEDEEDELEEALKVLIDGESNLTEDFKSKSIALFEAAISERMIAERAKFKDQYISDLEEEVAKIRDFTIDRVDSYLSVVVESWIEENSEQVDSSIRTDIAESFISSLKQLFTESYIEVPESKVDLFDDLAVKQVELEESIEEKTAEIDSLQKQVESFKREKIMSESFEGLSSVKRSKLSKIVADVEFVSEELFAEKVKQIVESVSATTEKSKSTTKNDLNESFEVEDGLSDDSSDVSPAMKAYLSALAGHQK